MRSRRMMVNAAFSLAAQLISILLGLYMTRLIITTFGSSTNGLITSITQFLSYIVLFEAGIGGLTRSLLYKPLSQQNSIEISGILRRAGVFYRKLALGFLGYSLLLALFYPLIFNNSFHFAYSSLMVLILAGGSFAQFYFGIKYSNLLQADQKSYIIIIFQTATVILNALAMVLLTKYCASIHVVKAGSMILYIIRPIALGFYVNRRYKIVKDAPMVPMPREQRTSGMVHSIAWFLHTNTDIIVLTLFSTLLNVSVYSIYFLVATSITRIATSSVSNSEAALGNLLAEEGPLAARKTFGVFSLFMNSMTVVLFSTAAVMVMPFMRLFTARFSDTNYISPLLAYLLLASEAVYCVRKPLHDIVTASGHFRETRKGAVIEIALNLILSIALVKRYSLPGVAFATFIAMLYRTLYLAHYVSRAIIYYPLVDLMKKWVLAAAEVFFFMMLSFFIGKVDISSYRVWLFYCMFVFACSLFVTIGMNLLFSREETFAMIRKLKKSLLG